MTKQQHLRAKGEIALAREDEAFTEAFINASVRMLTAAWRAQQAVLATRRETTQREIRVFCETL